MTGAYARRRACRRRRRHPIFETAAAADRMTSMPTTRRPPPRRPLGADARMASGAAPGSRSRVDVRAVQPAWPQGPLPPRRPMVPRSSARRGRRRHPRPSSRGSRWPASGRGRRAWSPWAPTRWLRVTISITNAGSERRRDDRRIGDRSCAGSGRRRRSSRAHRPAWGDDDVRRDRDQPRDDAEDAQRRLRAVTTEAVASRCGRPRVRAEIAERADGSCSSGTSVEQVDYKSARDVVTEVDHLSGAGHRAIRRGSRATGSSPRSPARTGSRADGPAASRSAHLVIDPSTAPSTTRTASRSSACPWPGRGRRPVGRRDPRPDARRDVRGRRRRAGRARARDGPRVRQATSWATRRVALALAVGPSRPRPRDPEGDPRVLQHGLGGARPGLRRQRRFDAFIQSGGCRRGRRRGRADRRASRGHGHRNGGRALVRRRARRGHSA